MAACAYLVAMKAVRLAVIGIAVALASRGAQAQTYLGDRPGVFATVDVYGSPFVFVLGEQTVGGAAGYRFGSGAEFALRVDHAAETDLGLQLVPRETFVGATAGGTLGRDRTPLKLSAVAGAAWEGESEIVFQTSTRPAGLRGGPRISQLKAAVSAVQHIRLASGPVRFWLGAGPLAEIRRVETQRVIFNDGGPDEVVSPSETRTEHLFGLALTAPVAVRVFGQSDLVLEPSVRAGTYVLALTFPLASAQLTVRLDL